MKRLRLTREILASFGYEDVEALKLLEQGSLAGEVGLVLGVARTSGPRQLDEAVAFRDQRGVNQGLGRWAPGSC